MKINATYILLLLLAGLAYTSCKKDQTLTTGGTIKFSVDTLMFDTVFTAQGSFTNSFKIYNPQNEKVVISSVRLQHGGTSYFHLNVDGFAGTTATNITIQPHDSIYVFATVNIDPKDKNTPYVVEDSFIAIMNGKSFVLPFRAYGQDAIYIVDSVLPANYIFDNVRPYVIIHGAEVAPMQKVTIKGGAHIYMHQDSWLYVLGTLIATGATKNDSITFQGDRTDRFYFGYEGYPGEWGGIYFAPNSKGSVLDHVILLNCGNTPPGGGPNAGIYVAIDSQHDASNPQLTLRHTIVQNSIGYGLLSLGGTVIASNCLINNCTQQALGLVQGGSYTISNSTFATYSYTNNHVVHSDNGTLAVLNYYDTSQTGYIPGNMNATLTNCVFYGSLDNEVFFHAKTGGSYSVYVNNCLMKSVDTLPNSILNLSGNILNQDPKFTDYTHFNYHPLAGSPLLNNGTLGTLPPFTDLDGNFVKNPPTIGCYQ
ncbi:MAG: hypothetical protein H0X33_13625 [Taibaiella sp.]|nr:hypothetical protein [Taibaiella sp.]